MYNILFVSHYSGINGAPKSMLGLLNSLDRSRFYPRVLLPEHGPIEEELIKAGIDYQIIDYRLCIWKDVDAEHPPQKYFEFYFSELVAVRRICRLMKEWKIDIIHTNSSVCDIGAISALIMRKIHIWHVREFISDDFGWKLICPAVERFLMKRSYVISNSKAVADMVASRYGAAAKVIYNGISSDEYYAEVHERCELGTIKLMIVGNVQEGKGQEEAIKAVALLKKKGYEVTLSIIGSTNEGYAKKLRILINERKLKESVKFISFVNDLRKLREQHDVVLICSRCEALGRVTIESMLAGIPVIGSNCGGTRELIGSCEERGYLYEQGNVRELAEKIEWFITHEEEARDKAVAAQNFAIKTFNICNYVKKIEHIYERCMK